MSLYFALIGGFLWPVTLFFCAYACTVLSSVQSRSKKECLSLCGMDDPTTSSSSHSRYGPPSPYTTPCIFLASVRLGFFLLTTVTFCSPNSRTPNTFSTILLNFTRNAVSHWDLSLFCSSNCVSFFSISTILFSSARSCICTSLCSVLFPFSVLCLKPVPALARSSTSTLATSSHTFRMSFCISSSFCSVLSLVCSCVARCAAFSSFCSWERFGDAALFCFSISASIRCCFWTNVSVNLFSHKSFCKNFSPFAAALQNSSLFSALLFSANEKAGKDGEEEEEEEEEVEEEEEEEEEEKKEGEKRCVERVEPEVATDVEQREGLKGGGAGVRGNSIVLVFVVVVLVAFTRFSRQTFECLWLSALQSALSQQSGQHLHTVFILAPLSDSPHLIQTLFLTEIIFLFLPTSSWGVLNFNSDSSGLLWILLPSGNTLVTAGT